MQSLSIALVALLTCLFSYAAAQTTTPECPTYNNTQFHDDNGITYTIYCGFDTSPGSFGSTTASSFSACIDLCDNTANCKVVSYVGTACYFKSNFYNTISSPSVDSAVFYVPPPQYPAPVANYVNASSGCGTALPVGQVAGASASTNVTVTAPDGTIRDYLIHIPATYNISKAAPLIISFHGRSSTPAAHEAESGWSTSIWNPYSIVIYPAGVNVRLADMDLSETHID